MDIIEELGRTSQAEVIKCVEMHTTGEVTRIVYEGFPSLSGSLLEQRKQALKHDRVRKRIMLEPRGHNDMYGAVLRPVTELVEASKADMGVLFCHNDGWSTMCGHATIALGRFLVDTHDVRVFPRRKELVFNLESKTVQLTLHTPCGPVRVTVPTTHDGQRSDPSRTVSFISVPSFAAAINLKIPIPSDLRWSELPKPYVMVDLAYGGAFYCIVKLSELGFANGLNEAYLKDVQEAAAKLKRAFNINADCLSQIRHPDIKDMEFLYSVVVQDTTIKDYPAHGTKGAEFGLCFFADSQLDRSPTGSAVCARVALAYAKGLIDLGDSLTYHSLVSYKYRGNGAFVGTASSVVDSQTQSLGYGSKSILVEVQGSAFYTGSSTFLLEQSDPVREGFSAEKLVGRID